MAEQVLSIMEIILDESNAEPLSEDKVSGAQSVHPETLGPCTSHCQQWACLCLALSPEND